MSSCYSHNIGKSRISSIINDLDGGKAHSDMPQASSDTPYEYVHKPQHYSIFSTEDLKRLVDGNEGIDVCAIAEKTGLDLDAYMFMVLKYVLRQNKPNEPRYRDVKKIREYSDLWLKKNGPSD